VCVSLGGVFFLAFLLIGLICLAKKKKKPVMVPVAPVCIEEHEVIQETITTGQCEEETATVSMEDDVRIHGVLGVVGSGSSSNTSSPSGPSSPSESGRQPKGSSHSQGYYGQ
jgi:hypothetical protein